MVPDKIYSLEPTVKDSGENENVKSPTNAIALDCPGLLVENVIVPSTGPPGLFP